MMISCRGCGRDVSDQIDTCSVCGTPTAHTHPDDDYFDWREMNTCPSCDGVGEDWIEDEFNPETGEYGALWVCKTCDGTGIDPNAEYEVNDE